MAYRVVMEPHGSNPGILKKAADKVRGTEVNENTGGIVIYLQDSTGSKKEFSRVAFVRRVSKNPDVSFRDQLKSERDRAQDACDELNDLFGSGDNESGELQ